MTYKKLLERLQQLNEEQLLSDVAVYSHDNDEYYQLNIDLVFANESNQVLDVNHPIIEITTPSFYEG